MELVWKIGDQQERTIRQHGQLAVACTCSATDKIIYSMNEIVLHASVHGNWHEHHLYLIRFCGYTANLTILIIALALFDIYIYF
ncbi:hypothetical protein ACFW04_005449 [Cataglyphis niger]